MSVKVFTFMVIGLDLLYLIICQDFLSVNKTNLMLHGERVFLSGVNQAWYNYGSDFGHANYSVSKPHLINTLDGIHASGGNSVRMWLHVGGFSTPDFNSSGYVTGLDKNLTRDLLDYVREAQKRNILVTLSLWNGAVNEKTLPLHGLIMDDRKLQSYIDKALIPMVQALKSEPGLGMWEIMNEPEGLVKVGVKNQTDPCSDTTDLHWYDFSDWTDADIPMYRVLRFISRQTSAIHRYDPKALVTVGSWKYMTVSSKFGHRDWYSDTCLLHASGGLSGSNLDLYQIHTYDTLFFYLPDDPFLNPADNYGLDKPLIIGEFSQKKGGMMTIQEQFTWAYNEGYNGAWSWSALNSDDASDPLSVQEQGMMTLKNKNDQSKGGRVNITVGTKDMYTYKSPIKINTKFNKETSTQNFQMNLLQSPDKSSTHSLYYYFALCARIITYHFS